MAADMVNIASCSLQNVIDVQQIPNAHARMMKVLQHDD